MTAARVTKFGMHQYRRYLYERYRGRLL